MFKVGNYHCKRIQPIAEHIKYFLYYHYRIQKQQFLMATEVMVGPRWVADFLVSDRVTITEIEIKVSMADLKKDVVSKKFKFEELTSFYNKKESVYAFYGEQRVPNKFFYCVPEKIAKKAQEYLKDTPYGLIIIPSYYHADDFWYCVKGSEDFNMKYPTSTEEKIIKRMASEIMILRKSLLLTKGNFDLETENSYFFAPKELESKVLTYG